MSQPRIVPLSKTRHAALTFSPLEDYSFTAAMNSMPLLGFEVVEASRCFAIAFPAAGSRPFPMPCWAWAEKMYSWTPGDAGPLLICLCTRLTILFR